MTPAEYRVLRCDNECGAELVCEQRNAQDARLDAAAKGWKFFNYTGLVIRSRNRAFLWDSCPECPLPATDAVQAKLEAAGGKRSNLGYEHSDE